jgi:hypothetical protein
MRLWPTGNKIAASNKSTQQISITSASQPLTTDQGRRARRYFISMMIRTICFILTVILPSPYRWFTLLAAVLLPYVAVVIANAGRETIFRAPSAILNGVEKQKGIGN